MKRIKIDSRAALGKVQLINMIRICVEGATVTDFNPLPAIALWLTRQLANQINENKDIQST